MIKRRTQLLGASAILIGLSAPFAVQAHGNDHTWLYVAGTFATYAHFSGHAYNHHDHRYAERHWRKHQRRARRHHIRAYRHHRQMRHVSDHHNLRYDGFDDHHRYARRHDDHHDRRRSGYRHS